MPLVMASLEVTIKHRLLGFPYQGWVGTAKYYTRVIEDKNEDSVILHIKISELGRTQ